MLVLRTLIFGPLHGYGIAKAIRSTSNEALDIEFGSLYPALKRLELKGWIGSKWDVSDHNRKAKFYSLTRSGHARLRKETDQWNLFTTAMGYALETTPEEI